MNLSVGFLIVLANAIAMHILLNRLNQTSFGSRFILESQAEISTIFNSHPEACGLSGWSDYAISSKRVFLPTGIRPATVHVSEGKVVGLSEYSPSVKLKTFNFGDALISPGFIDVHVHLDEPGRDEWEGITSGTAAAAVGGITTVVDMPLNNHPSTTSTALLKEKQAISQAKSHVDMGFWAGLVPGNAGDHEELASLIAHGAAGFKSFLCPSGINDFAHVGADDLAKALPFLKAAGVPLFVHAELASELPPHQGAPQAYRTYLDSRPPRFERDAITLLVQLLDRDNTSTSPGFHLHIAHLSDAKSLDIIMEAQRRHPITVETCPHYLMFAAEDIPDRATQFKCAPPIRPAANREDLLDGVARGAFFAVSSDHSPSHPSLKSLDTGDFMAAWGGISGLQYLLPAAWTALLARDVGIIRFTELMAENPAKMLGLERSKGRIAQGFDADFTVWDPEAEVNTSTAASQHKHKLSPYTNVRLQGKTLATVVRGNFVYLLSRLSEKPCGRPVHRA